MLQEIVLSCDGKKPKKISFEKLLNYNGKKDLTKVKSLKAKADTSQMTLSFLGDVLPGLQILRLDYSIFSCIRDLSTHLPHLKVLSLTHCELTSIDGIATISTKLQELYLGFNTIDDLSPLLGFNQLKILDLENNFIFSVEDTALLKCCTALKNLTLRGTGAAENPEYRQMVKQYIPKLQILDGVKFGEEEEEKKPEDQQLPPLHEQPPAIEPPIEETSKLPDLKETKVPGTSDNQKRPSASQINKFLPPKKKIQRPKSKPKIWHNIGPIKL